jgi:hypothetical protein
LHGAFLLAHHPKLPDLISTMLMAMQKRFASRNVMPARQLYPDRGPKGLGIFPWLRR